MLQALSLKVVFFSLGCTGIPWGALILTHTTRTCSPHTPQSLGSHPRNSDLINMGYGWGIGSNVQLGLGGIEVKVSEKQDLYYVPGAILSTWHELTNLLTFYRYRSRVPDRRENFSEATEQFLEPAFQPSLLAPEPSSSLTAPRGLSREAWLMGVGEKGRAGEMLFRFCVLV